MDIRTIFLMVFCSIWVVNVTTRKKKTTREGPLRESNPGPLPPEGRIIPLDQADKKMILAVDEIRTHA